MTRPRRCPLLALLMVLVAVLLHGAAAGWLPVEAPAGGGPAGSTSVAAVVATPALDRTWHAAAEDRSDGPGSSCPTEHDPLQDPLGTDALRTTGAVGDKPTFAPCTPLTPDGVTQSPPTGAAPVVVAARSGTQICALLCVSRR